MGLTQVSTDGVKDDAIDASKLPANSVGASELANNSVDTAAVADDAITQAKLNFPVANRNLIINGAMQVAQRGTSSNTAGYQTVDRFRTQINNGTLTQSQQNLATSHTPYTLGFRKYMRILNQSGIGAATNQYAQIDYKVEAQDLANSGWNFTSNTSKITLSFWVRASVTAKYFGWLLTNDGTVRNHPFVISDSNGSGTNLTANTWTKITKTFTGDSGITINNDNGIGFQISFVAYYGTDFTNSSVSTTSWNTFTSGGYSPDFPSTTWATTTNATFDITGVQLEIGSVATDFEHRLFAQELALCQRYCQKLGASNGTYDCMGTGNAIGSGFGFIAYRLLSTMRSTPSFTLLGAASDFNYTRDGGDHAPTAIVLDQAGKNMVAVKMTGTSLNNDDAIRLFNMNTTGGYLFTAEL